MTSFFVGIGILFLLLILAFMAWFIERRTQKDERVHELDVRDRDIKMKEREIIGDYVRTTGQLPPKRKQYKELEEPDEYEIEN